MKPKFLLTGLGLPIDVLMFVSFQKGSTSLRLASEEGHLEVVEKLLQHGAQVDLGDEVYYYQ